MTGETRGGPGIGEHFAGYRIEERLGRGGMGVVYLARDERLDRPVALKLVAPRLADDPGFRDRFLTESQLAAALDHSHVVPIYEAGEADGQLYLAMRYVEGTTLRELLHKEGKLDPARALDLCEQIAEALDAAHDRGLVHLDVKPGNVLIADESARDHCYLCDFGLSRHTGGPPEGDGMTGTVAYTAPEQIRGEGVDGRADQYALACVLCECLTGQPPFPRTAVPTTLFAHLQDSPPSLRERREELPAEVDAVVGRGLAKDPADRYATCRELVEELRAALGLDPSRLSRRALLVAAGAAAAVTAAAALPAILLTRSNGSVQAAQPRPLLPVKSHAVLRLDPAGTVTDVLDVPSGLGPIVFGEGSVWLADKERKVVSRIDPAASTVAEEIDATDKGDPGGLAVGEGALWIFAGDWTATALRRYDLQTQQWSDVDLEGVNSENILVADGALWSVCDEILRIDPKTGDIDAQMDTGMQGKLVAAGEGGSEQGSRIQPREPRMADRPRDECSRRADRLQGDGRRHRRGRRGRLDAYPRG